MGFEHFLEMPLNNKNLHSDARIFIKIQTHKVESIQKVIVCFLCAYVFKLRRLFVCVCVCRKGIKIKIAEFIIVIAFVFLYSQLVRGFGSMDGIFFRLSIVDGKYIQSELRFSFHSNTYRSTRSHYFHLQCKVWRRKANKKMRIKKYLEKNGIIM